MIQPFEYLRPATLAEATALCREHAGEYMLLAGGTDVVVSLSAKGKSAPYLISLRSLEQALSYIEKRDDGVHIGAMTTFDQLDNSALVWELYPALAKAASLVGSPQVRNMGTLGGNLGSSLPSADTASPLQVLDAQLVLTCAEGEELLPVNGFFLGVGKNLLKPGQIIREVLLPLPAAGSSNAYDKLGRRNALEIALCAAAAYLELSAEGVCREARFSLTSSAPTPLRCRKAEEAVKGVPLSDEAIRRACALAEGEASPRSSFRCTEEYRRHVIPVILENAIRAAMG